MRVVIFVVIIVVAIVIAIATFVDTIVVRIASSGPLVVIVIVVVVLVIVLSFSQVLQPALGPASPLPYFTHQVRQLVFAFAIFSRESVEVPHETVGVFGQRTMCQRVVVPTRRISSVGWN